ncbi:MAG: bifunctional 4-hydroxy-2-oxoglutarate aldolase/2-dehydro-3-deoxy-phosphogluconate aldolase [Kiritimatiellae bacterium]|nr:bifunctional 4-hydroxy-2-oxoglutarate aldolase/2-dehydro-3-deoxy-phosphogluconate aldolase [Kiritimatiellia bacterium]
MINEVAEQFAAFGVVPVVEIKDEAWALPLADALIAGGLPVAEITFRTAAAEGVIRTLARERPQLLIGAGTVLTAENLERALAAGAKFAVAPGLNPEIVRAAQAAGLPFLPGVATPSDIERGLSLGCRLLKFFPAEALGGVKLLKAFSGPYRHMGVRFMPTGGINPDNLRDYLRIPVVAAAGGTWIARAEDMEAGNWDAIADRCRAACRLAADRT